MLSRFKNHAVDQVVPPELANGNISFACLASDADRLELQTHWLNEQRSDRTLARAMRCIDAACKPNGDEIELNPGLQKYLDIWTTLVVESGHLRNVNESRHSWCVVVPPPLRDDFVRSPPASTPRRRINATPHYSTLLVATHLKRRVRVCSSVRNLRSRSLLKPEPPHVVRTASRRKFIRRSIHRHRRGARLSFTRRVTQIYFVND